MQKTVIEAFLLSDGFDGLTASAAKIVDMCLPNAHAAGSPTLIKIYYWNIMRALKIAAQKILPILSVAKNLESEEFNIFVKLHPELREVILLAQILHRPLKKAAKLQMRLVAKNHSSPCSSSLKQLIAELLSPAEFEVLKLHQKLVAGKIDEEDIVAETEYSLRQFIIIRDETLNKLKKVPALSKILS